MVLYVIIFVVVALLVTNFLDRKFRDIETRLQALEKETGIDNYTFDDEDSD